MVLLSFEPGRSALRSLVVHDVSHQTHAEIDPARTEIHVGERAVLLFQPA